VLVRAVDNGKSIVGGGGHCEVGVCGCVGKGKGRWGGCG
jgi:hypothetical protein